MITDWVKEVGAHAGAGEADAEHRRHPARWRARRRRGGADGLSAINTINSITGVDLDTLTPRPERRTAIGARRLLRAGGEADRAAHGPADRGDPRCGLPISGIGGMSSWRDAAEFILLGCGNACRSARRYALRLPHRRGHDRRPEELDGREGLSHHRRFPRPEPAAVTEWKHLDLNYKIVARIDQDKCIGCDLCYIACWDGAHQCIHLIGMRARTSPEASGGSDRRDARRFRHSIADADGRIGGRSTTPLARIPRVDEDECVGCNLCWLVCPVEDCITMERVETGTPPETWEAAYGGEADQLQ